MTLISYPTRVHFADDVLQEALHSELERAGSKAPLLVSESVLIGSEFADRVLEGLPGSAMPQTLNLAPHADLSQCVKSAMGQLSQPDVIIAFGSARAIEFGRKCRYALKQKYGDRPQFYAVPGLDGLPGPCTRNVENWRAGLPSVLICDPTVTLDADPEQCWLAAVLSLVRCIESYLGAAYNPPADGMALDALSRCVVTLPKCASKPRLDLHREVMAAGLNAALSQEKGVGPSLVLAAALAEPKLGLKVPELARLILPAVIQNGSVNAEKATVLLKVLGGPEQALDAAVKRILDPVPMGRSLSELGIGRDDLDRVSTQVNGKAGLTSEGARAVLETIY